MNLNKVKEDIASGKSTMIYFSDVTLWWTHLDNDMAHATLKGRDSLLKTTNKIIADNRLSDEHKRQARETYNHLIKTGANLDPKGNLILTMSQPEKYIQMSEDDPSVFGRHGLYAFMKAHHQNSKHWIPEKWDDVNQYIDDINVMTDDPTDNRSDFEKAIDESIRRSKQNE